MQIQSILSKNVVSNETVTTANAKELHQFLRRNEKNELLKPSENLATMGVNEGLSRMSFKKIVKDAQSAKV